MATFDGRSGSNDRRLVSNSSNHTTAVNATTANAGTESGGGQVSVTSDERYPTSDFYIRRALMEFDLTSVPVGSTITNSPTVKIRFAGPTSGRDDNNMSANLFYFTRGSSENTAFVANDFDEAKGTTASTAADITGLTSTHTFTLNAGAIADLEDNFGGYAQISLRISGDYNNSAPPSDNDLNQLEGYMGNDGTESNRPRLEFTYSEPTTTTTTTTSTTTSTTSSTSSTTSSSSTTSTETSTTSTSTSTSSSSSTSSSTSTSSTTTQEPTYIPSEDISGIKGTIVYDTPLLGDLYD